MPEQLTHGERELVWGIQSQVAVISSMSRRIDETVQTLNALRAEAAERLERLDLLNDSAGDDHLRAYLQEATATVLPTVLEIFPERLYGR